MIHPTAIIDSSAKLPENITVGPYSVIGPNVEIGEGTVIGPHVVIKGPTRIGCDNKFYQFSSIGEDPQDKKYEGRPTHLEIGDRNIVRECSTIHRGTSSGTGITRIGDDNFLMAYTHIAHDCLVGNHCIFANNASIAGHVNVEDFVGLGAFTGVHQFCNIGTHSFSAASTIIIKDVPPFMKVSGYFAKAFGLNTTGLKRRGFSDAVLSQLRQAYKVIYRQGLTVAEAVEQLNDMALECPEVKQLIVFLEKSERGIVR